LFCGYLVRHPGAHLGHGDAGTGQLNELQQIDVACGIRWQSGLVQPMVHVG
jgi:hypothetical protein